MNKETRPVPEVGKKCHFFDDGKVSDSRHYIATVNRIITLEEAKDMYIPDCFREHIYLLYNAWEEGKADHPWLFASDTDCIVECNIPEYDKDPIYFARGKEGEWWSFNVTNSWQTGYLDIDGRWFDEYSKEREYSRKM